MSADAGRVPQTARSKLEELLDSIRNRDDRPKDKPPDLPTRPISKGRLPKSKRSSPSRITIRINSHVPVSNDSSMDRHLKIKDKAFSCWILRNKGVKAVPSEESPYDTFEQDTLRENGNVGFNSVESPLSLSEVPFKVRICQVVLFIAFQIIEYIVAKFKINDAVRFQPSSFLCLLSTSLFITSSVMFP